MDYVEVKTIKDGYERTVTIAYYDKEVRPQLLGALAHNTYIVINRELIAGLTEILEEWEFNNMRPIDCPHCGEGNYTAYDVCEECGQNLCD